MSNRKENIKKTLGISEYPWSSDDDDSEAPAVQVVRTHQSGPDVRASIADTPGHSGTQNSSRRETGQGLWSLSLNNPRASTVNFRRNREDGPISLVSRTSSSSERTGAQDMQRVLAFRRLSRQPSTYRPARTNVGGDLSFINNMQRAAQRLARALSDPKPMFLRDLSDPEMYSTAEMNAIMRSTSPQRSDIARQTSDAALGYMDGALPSNPASSRAELNTDAEAGTGTEEVDGSHTIHETSAMSLEEEVVEIDAEPEPAPSDTGPDSRKSPDQHNNNEEPVPTTSAASETPSSQPHGVKRKRESDDDSSEISSVKEFNQNLLRLLECPVCLEWMEPPMWQCRRGHLVCGRCRARLAACPVCRTAFSSVRNRAMEGVAEMVRYPCRHGCGRDLQLRRRATHEASCAARRYRCPAPACDHRPPLQHHDLADHFQSKHLAMVKVGRKHKFSMKVNSEQHDNWIIMALHQLFHLRVVVDIRTWGVVVYVAYIGPKCNADYYTYEVTVIGQHNSRKLVYTRATHCDLECSSLNVNRQDCFHLTLDQALNFLRVKNRHCEPDKYLNFNLEISRSTPNEEDVDS